MFTSASCGPCRLADYFFRNLEGSQKYPDVAFVKVDVCSEEGKALYDKYDVQGLPTILYFNDGDAFGSPSRGGKAVYSYVSSNFLYIHLDFRIFKQIVFEK